MYGEMSFSNRQRLITKILFIFTLLLAVGIGTTIGLAVSGTSNLEMSDELREYRPALPSQILDRKGRLITEIFADEKRDIVTIRELPKHLLFALLTREDDNFFAHRGFSLKGITRAMFHLLTGGFSGGGSTISQQVAGRHFADRSDISIRRKIRELWYSFQLEKAFTKDQILNLYMNEEYFGHNTYGVEAASQFYFEHSARRLSPAESALLVIQLSSPAKYSPIKNPNNAKGMQRDVLNRMVQSQYLSSNLAEESFQRYWNNYDYTRSNISSAYFENTSKAPYFTEYVRIQLEEMLYGALDINRDGFIIHTTLDLDYQKAADELMNMGLVDVNKTYQENSNKRMAYVEDEFVPIIDMLALAFNIQDIMVAGAQKLKDGKVEFHQYLGPALDVLSMMVGSEDIQFLSNMAYANREQESKKNTVEGALVTIDNETGHILAMVGGSDFKTKQLNRAVQAKVQPGSAFKPLYYSAAISSRKFTPASLLYDSPIVLTTGTNKPYTPLNYMDVWKGPVLLRTALANSMNVPSIKVMDGIGFDLAIERASRLLGITDPVEIATSFPRNYPLALGVISVSPLKMAKAFSTFANEGKEVIPVSITFVEDRQGNIVLEPEKEIRAEQKRRGDDMQIMSPQEAYIMVSMLESTVEFGTLAGRRVRVGGFNEMAMAGKTGTTQNWSDAWTVGFSPYMTTAVWFGFDIPGNSLGINQTGATAAGPVWAKYMKTVHSNLPPRDFKAPESGISFVEVCEISGDLPTEFCTDGIIKEIFLPGTEPRRFCTIHEYKDRQNRDLLEKLKNSILAENVSVEEFELPGLEDPFFEELSIEADLEDIFGSNKVENPLLD